MIDNALLVLLVQVKPLLANVITKLGLPAMVLAPNKTLAAQLYSEFKIFPSNAVEYFVSYYDYYQPEAYVPSKLFTYEKDSVLMIILNKCDYLTIINAKKDVIIVASVSCIYGIGDPVNFPFDDTTYFFK